MCLHSLLCWVGPVVVGWGKLVVQSLFGKENCQEVRGSVVKFDNLSSESIALEDIAALGETV